MKDALEYAVESTRCAGNAAAMREALEAINRIDTRGLKRLLCELVEADIFDGGQINKTISAVEKARRALSAPARQCDVGTPDEQDKRFTAMCSKFEDCLGCPFNVGRFITCEFAWGQTPYAEKKGSEE